MRIGVFDSGKGGLSVLKELKVLLPEVEFIYFADTEHCPYGNKPVEYIIDRAREITRNLLSEGCECIVVACNTATAAAIETLRREFDVPFVGIEPAIKPAAAISKTKVVGVLATANTLKLEKYHRTRDEWGKDVKVIEVPGTGLVECVEQGTDATPLLRKYIPMMLEQNADVIVLGCTHFPFLEEQIRAIAGADVSIINPAPAVARRVAEVMKLKTETTITK
ncbi:MAG: glutamate racemase [Bacteroidales bacterium]|nr:glutamate racemase [Bacteroidales bacterium]